MLEFCESSCFCYPEGFLSYQVTKYAVEIGKYGWYGMAALRIYDAGQIWLYFSIFLGLVASFVDAIVKAFYFQTRPCRCLNFCVSNADAGMPANEIFYAVALFAYLLTFDYMRGFEKFFRGRNLMFGLVAFAVPLVLWYTQNYTALQTVVSVILAALVGIVSAMFWHAQSKNVVPLVLGTSYLRDCEGLLKYLVPYLHDSIMMPYFMSW